MDEVMTDKSEGDDYQLTVHAAGDLSADDSNCMLISVHRIENRQS
jgi:hypothetical protein